MGRPVKSSSRISWRSAAVRGRPNPSSGRLDPRRFGLAERVAQVDDDFELISPIANIEIIARGRGIRDLPQLQRLYGRGKMT